MLALLVLIGKGTGRSVFRDYLPVGILLTIYYATWDMILWQGTVARKGIFYEFFLNRTLHTVAVLYIVDNILFSRKLIKTLVLTIKIMIVIGAVMSLFQVIYDPFLFTPDRFEHMMLRYSWGTNLLHVRRLSVFGFSDVNDIGVSFLPVMALITGYEIKEKRKVPVVMLLLGFFIAVVNNSRYIQLGFFVAAAPALMYQGKIIRNLLVALIGLLAMVLVMGFVLHLIGYDVGRYVEERLLDASGESRLLALDIFARFFPDTPFFGTGQHLTREVVVALAGRSSQIHVGYLSHLFSYGIVGTSLALFFWGLIVHRLWKVARQTGFYGSFFGFMVFLWGNVTMVYFWVFTFGLALCYLFSSYYESKEKEFFSNDKK
jgi:hypothetical protein